MLDEVNKNIIANQKTFYELYLHRLQKLCHVIINELVNYNELRVYELKELSCYINLDQHRPILTILTSAGRTIKIQYEEYLMIKGLKQRYIIHLEGVSYQQESTCIDIYNDNDYIEIFRKELKNILIAAYPDHELNKLTKASILRRLFYWFKGYIVYIPKNQNPTMYLYIIYKQHFDKRFK